MSRYFYVLEGTFEDFEVRLGTSRYFEVLPSIWGIFRYFEVLMSNLKVLLSTFRYFEGVLGTFRYSFAL